MRALPLVAILALAGCLAPGSDPPPIAAPFVDPIVERHDHLDPAEHNLSWNMELLHWDPLAPQGAVSGAHAVDLRGEHLFVALQDEPLGFAILSLADPARPSLVSTFDDERATGGDRNIAVSEDGDWVFLANEGTVVAVPGVTGVSDPERAGIRIVDVSDKAAPRFVNFVPVGVGGVHTIYSKDIGGATYVFGLSNGVNIYRLVDDPVAEKTLQLVAKYVTATPNQLARLPDPTPQENVVYARRVVGAHDMTVVEDEELGRVLMYVAYSYDGFKIVDITDPADPQELASWVPDGPGAPYYVHSAEVTWIDGRRIVVVGSEVFENRNFAVPSPIWVLDASDVAAPREVGEWHNPGEHGSASILHSAHFYRIEDAKVYMAHYHAGVWVIDIADPAAPRHVGYYLPHNDNGYRPEANCCNGLDHAGIPDTFDIEVRDGIAYAADLHSGLYALRLV
ncbi:MAG: LVIVD repeat-containing protein [Methanobacteriota archaeon]